VEDDRPTGEGDTRPEHDAGGGGPALAHADRAVDASDGDENPRHSFLTALEVIARYGWGRTKGYRLLRSHDFPRPIGGDRYRLDALMAWEDRQLTAALKPTTLAVLPPRRRRTARSA